MDSEINKMRNCNASDNFYCYYIYEDDFFRGTSTEGTTEVLRTGKWLTYKGDPFEPVFLGTRIDADALPGTAAALAGSDLTEMTRQEILAANARLRRQIEILEVPARPRGRPTPRVTQLIADLKSALGELEIQLAKREQKPSDSARGIDERFSESR